MLFLSFLPEKNVTTFVIFVDSWHY